MPEAKELAEFVKPEFEKLDLPVYIVSTASHEGLKELNFALANLVTQMRADIAAREETVEEERVVINPLSEPGQRASHEGLKELNFALANLVTQMRADIAAREETVEEERVVINPLSEPGQRRRNGRNAGVQEFEIEREEDRNGDIAAREETVEEERVVINPLSEPGQRRRNGRNAGVQEFEIEREEDRNGNYWFTVTGTKPERWVVQTNFDNDEAVGYLADRLAKLGVEDALRKNGARPGDEVRIGRGARAVAFDWDPTTAQERRAPGRRSAHRAWRAGGRVRLGSDNRRRRGEPRRHAARLARPRPCASKRRIRVAAGVPTPSAAASTTR